MKSEYEKEVYKFFTQPDNFDTMVKVASHADEVAQQLIKEFWEELEKLLKIRVHTKGSDWFVGYSAKYKERYCKLQIYHRDWLDDASSPVITVAFEDLHFGEYPFVGISVKHDNEYYDTEAIRYDIRQLKTLSLYEEDSSLWWAKSKYLTHDFSRRENLSQILPGNREVNLENAVEEAMILLEAIESDVPSILAKSKK
ncbi:MAG: hypothetical protein RIE86_02975 [Imperialibacter sp.]|uniref:hypothetical protein n=1 Tax=Imperialibacter sp. TaxID=2038411 RepID=UPI0032EEEB5F